MNRTVRAVMPIAFLVAAIPLAPASTTVSPRTPPPGLTDAISPDQQPMPQAPGRDRQPARPGTAVISGRVVTETGTPLRRAAVRVSSETLRDGRVAQTDADGRFEMAALPAGTYSLFASKTGYVEPDTTESPASVRSLKVGAGEKIQSRDLVLVRGSAIAGHVLDEYGDPVPYARVEVLRRQFRNRQYRLSTGGFSASTDDLGQYRVFGLRPGNYYVSAKAEGRGAFGGESDAAGYAITYYPGTPSLGSAVPVRVVQGQDALSTDFTLVPTRVARVSGVVLDSLGRPAANATVSTRQLVPGLSYMGESGTSVREGVFTLSNVAPGDYLINARSTQYGGPGFAGGTTDSRSAAPEAGRIRVTVSGSDIAGLTIQMSKGGTVSGEVVFDGTSLPSAPPRRMSIRAVPADSDAAPMLFTAGPPSEVRSDNAFALTGLFGPLLFRVDGLPSGWGLKSVTINGRDVTDAPVNFEGREQVTGMQVVVTDRVTKLGGDVTDGQGQAVTNAVVMVLPQDAERWSDSSRYVAQAAVRNGRWTITGLPPGDYFAVALDALAQRVMQNADDQDPREMMRRVGTAFSLGDGESKDLPLRLARLGERP